VRREGGIFYLPAAIHAALGFAALTQTHGSTLIGAYALFNFGAALWNLHFARADAEWGR
jgi:hypothetical protein